MLSVSDQNYRQPLHVAVAKSDATPDFVEEMIDNKADVGAITKYGKTPLRIAISAKNLKIVEVLTKRGAPLRL